MKQPRFHILMLLALITSSTATAQNDLIFMLTFEDEMYNWYTYNQRLPKNQQVEALKTTEYEEEGDYTFKLEKYYYYTDYKNNNYLYHVGFTLFIYSQEGELYNFPMVGSESYYFSKDDDKRLIGYSAYGQSDHFIYDQSGRLNECESYNYLKDFGRETLRINYVDNTSDIIKSMYYTTPDHENERTWNFIYDENYSHLTINDTALNALREFEKINNRWVMVKFCRPNEVETFNDDGILTSSKYNDCEINYFYNQNGDLIKVVNTDAKGNKEVKAEFEYEYNSRNNWVKQWSIKDGKRRLAAEREYIYLEQ